MKKNCRNLAIKNKAGRRTRSIGIGLVFLIKRKHKVNRISIIHRSMSIFTELIVRDAVKWNRFKQKCVRKTKRRISLLLIGQLYKNHYRNHLKNQKGWKPCLHLELFIFMYLLPKLVFLLLLPIVNSKDLSIICDTSI